MNKSDSSGVGNGDDGAVSSQEFGVEGGERAFGEREGQNPEVRRRALLTQLRRLGAGMIRGSVIRSSRECANMGCACHGSREHRHPFIYLSRSKKDDQAGRQRNSIVYVRECELPEFENAVRMYDELWRIVDELSELNIQAIKARHHEQGARTRRRARGGDEGRGAAGLGGGNAC